MPRVQVTSGSRSSKIAFRYEPGSSLVRDGVEVRIIEVDKDGIDLTDDEAAVALSYNDIRVVPEPVIVEKAPSLGREDTTPPPVLIEETPDSVSAPILVIEENPIPNPALAEALSQLNPTSGESSAMPPAETPSASPGV